MKLSSFRAWLSLLCLGALLFLPSSVFAATQTVEADGYYTIGDGMEENFSVARERAKQDALGRAAEKAGVYVEKSASVKNHQLTSSDLKTLAAQVLKVQDATYENTVESNVFKIHCHVVVSVNDDNVLASLVSDRQKLTESLKREQEKDARIADLNRQMEVLTQQYQAAKTDEERARLRREAQANDTSFTAAQWVEKGIRAMRDKSTWDKAIEYFNQAIALDSTDDIAYNDLGTVYFSKGMYDKAIEFHNKAIALNPNSFSAYVNLGLAYGSKGMHQNAIDCYNKAMAIQPDNFAIYYNLGNAYSRKGDYSNAIEAYNKAVALAPRFPNTYIQMGQIYNRIGAYDYAIECFAQVITLDPKSVQAYRELGLACALKGKPEMAIEAWSQAIALDPKDANTYFNRGVAYENLKRRKEAKRDYAEAYRLMPQNQKYAKAKRNSENW